LYWLTSKEGLWKNFWVRKYREKINEVNVISETPVYLTHFFVNIPNNGFPTANSSTAQFNIIHEVLVGFVEAEEIVNAIRDNNNNAIPCAIGFVKIISLSLNEWFTYLET
jgi:hypothetical protein